MTCPFCHGRGWTWVGDLDNAFRDECEPCAGRGHGRVRLPMLAIPWLLSGVLWGLVCGAVSWAITHRGVWYAMWP